jgi:hypothetical protein
MINILLVYELRPLWFCAHYMTHTSNVTRLVKILICDISLTKMNSKTLSEQALRVPQGSGSQISKQSAHEDGSPTHRPPLLTAVRVWFDPRFIVRSGGLRPLWIEPATFRLVAQCLNQLRHRVPQPTAPPRASRFRSQTIENLQPMNLDPAEHL